MSETATNTVLSEDEFEAAFRPIPLAKDGSEILRDVTDATAYAANPKQVWTVVETGGGGLNVIAGMHRVNRFGFVITEKEWVTGHEEAIFAPDF